jgi:hypothetical protein
MKRITIFCTLLLVCLSVPSLLLAQGYANLQLQGGFPVGLLADVGGSPDIGLATSIGYEISDFFAPEFKFSWHRFPGAGNNGKYDNPYNDAALQCLVSTSSTCLVPGPNSESPTLIFNASNMFSFLIGGRATLHLDYWDVYGRIGIGPTMLDGLPWLSSSDESAIMNSLDALPPNWVYYRPDRYKTFFTGEIGGGANYKVSNWVSIGGFFNITNIFVGSTASAIDLNPFQIHNTDLPDPEKDYFNEDDFIGKDYTIITVGLSLEVQINSIVDRRRSKSEGKGY